YGPQLGVDGEWCHGAFTVGAYAKLALGDSHERSSIGGSTTAVQPDGTRSTALGGTLALSTNIGRRTHDVLAVLPEVGINLGLQLTDEVRIFVGYSVLYW